MKLNKEQIQTVENYLNKIDLDYLDIHFEVLDHISTDIENLMAAGDQLNFNEAFEAVKKKWKKSFKYESSILISVFHARPSIFLNRCLKIYKPYYRNAMLIVFLSVFGFGFFQKHVLQNLEIFNLVIINLFLITSLFYVWFVFYFYFKIKKTKLKTSYSYLHNTQIAPNILVLVLILSNISKGSFLKIDSLYIFMFFLLVLSIYQGFIFCKKHLKIVSNYKEYQLK